VVDEDDSSGSSSSDDDSGCRQLPTRGTSDLNLLLFGLLVMLGVRRRRR
jgi:hypothetical protein